MEYYLRFSVIHEEYGLMGIRDVEMNVDSPEELKAEIKAFYEENDKDPVSHLLDEIYDEDGKEVKL